MERKEGRKVKERSGKVRKVKERSGKARQGQAGQERRKEEGTVRKRLPDLVDQPSQFVQDWETS